MKHHILRATAIALVTFLLGSGIDYLTNLESTVGLNTLFGLRGARRPPADVVVVAMDEASETRLGVGQDLTRWRQFHAGLIRQLQRQGAALIVFDLQFIVPHPEVDAALAAAIKAAGNVLLTDCVQKFRHGTEDYYGREECSENYKEPAVRKEGSVGQPLSEQLVAMRKIPATPMLIQSVLDHAPFVLVNDAKDATVREIWTYYDALAETPSLPVVVWLNFLRRSGVLSGGLDAPLSQGLTEQRRHCLNAKGHGAGKSALEKRIVAVICGEDSRYLDYYGPPHTFRMESYSDVYEGKVSDLRDKVIFVGKANRLYASGKTDYFQTPFTDSRSGRMAGVEIMATQFANLSEGRFVESPLPPWLPQVAFGFLIGLILMRLTGFYGLLVSLLAGGAYASLVFGCFTRYSLWLPVAAPLLIQLPLSWLIALSWSRLDLLNERKRILDFVHQVFPQWLHFLPASPGQWYPEKNAAQMSSERYVRALCLATDIEGYTAVAAQHSPREMWELLKSYYQVLGFPVTSHDGIIANIQGDEMMALWVDLCADSQRHSACLAALEIEQAVERFNQTSTVGRLPTRIGLHEGEIVLGSGESGGFRFYNPFGDTVNTASRIQGVNKYLGTKILASKAVADSLTQVVCRPVGKFRVEGRCEALELVEIIDKATDDNDPNDWIHRKFAHGLRLFQQGNWAQAVLVFQNILNEHGNDNPSRYYLERAQAYQQQPPADWDGVVTLEQK